MLNLILSFIFSVNAHGCRGLDGPLTAGASPAELTAALLNVWPAARTVIDELGRKYRRGWEAVGIPTTRGETVWAHSLNLTRAIGHYGRSDPTFEVARGLWMGLTHDFVEWRVIDYIPADGIDPRRKHALEAAAWEDLIQLLGPHASFLKNLWLEFEAGETRVARLIQQLDALDAFVKACEYDRAGYDVSNFFASIGARLSEPRLITIKDELLARREDRRIDPRRLYHQRLAGRTW